MGRRVSFASSSIFRLTLLVVVAVSAAACGPTIDPAAKADLDRRLSEITTSEETYPPSESYSPMAFIVGQWTEHRITDDKGRASLVTYKLVGQESGAFWLEIVSETPNGREAAKLLVAMLAGRDPAGMEIRALRIKKGSKDTLPVDVDPGTLPEVRKKYRRSLDLFAITVEGNEEKDDVRVPAGHFIGCYRVETPSAWGPWPVPADVCTHPTVPLSGVVRATPSGAAGLVELVRFGVTGAESEF
jgi:hypothetical protein